MRFIARECFLSVYLLAKRAAVAVAMVGVLISGCAGPSVYPRAVSEDEDRYVRLEARYGYGQEGTAMRFSHPVILGQAEWTRILQEMDVKPRQGFVHLIMGDAELVEAFEETDRQYLAQHLSEAFSRARPDEWVVFYLSHPREQHIAEITSGGFFIEGEQLHLVLANYREPVSMSYVKQEIWNDPLRPAGDSFYRLVPREHQTLRTYRRWYPTKPLLAHPAELVIDYKPILHTSVPSARGTDTDEGNGAPSGHDAMELEEQFRLLKRLYEQGLITDEEYAVQRRKLLDGL